MLLQDRKLGLSPLGERPLPGPVTEGFRERILAWSSGLGHLLSAV